MVTREQLNEHLGRQPFRRFRVVLVNGEAIDIVRRAQGVVMSGRFVVGVPPRFDARWIQLDQLDRIEAQEVRPTGS
jgi:hypothetical protein